MKKASALALSLLSAPALAGGAGTVGYAQASGYFKQDSRPTLYQPLNLLDGRNATAWCSPTADPLNELLTVGFNGPVTIHELKVSTGNSFDTHTFENFGRAKKLKLTYGKKSQIVNVEDVAEAQTITLNPPITAARLRIEVLDHYPAEDPEASVCITDLVFVSDGKPLNGDWLTTKLKYDKYIAQLMGAWFAGFDTTPDRFLHFNFDGTFRYSFEPFDTTRAKEKVVEGTYDVGAGRVTFNVAGKKYPVRYTKDAAKKPTQGQQLSFDGELPEDLKGPFRSQP